MIQALDALRAATQPTIFVAPPTPPSNTDGRIVSVRADAATGSTSDVDIGHQTTFEATTGGDGTPGGDGTGFGEDRNFLFDTNLQAFVALTNPTIVADNADGQATFGDAQNAVEDIANIERAIRIVVEEFGDRFPADDGVLDIGGAAPVFQDLSMSTTFSLDLSDLGELEGILANVTALLAAAEAELNSACLLYTSPSPRDS